jgi:hypothetical protein
MPYDSSVIDSEPAVIYRLYPYSDNSAIAVAVGSAHGKVKLFIKNAYGKKNTPFCLVPGSLSFSFKSNGLHRFRSFAHNPDYYHYIQNSDISIRMNLCFDFFDQLFYSGEISRSFWKLILKFTPENFRELSLYTIYRLLKDAGFWFYRPCACGKMEGVLTLYNGLIACEGCPPPHGEGIAIKRDTAACLAFFDNTEAYRTVKFSAVEETAVLTLFASYLDAVLEKKEAVKSLRVFSGMALSL